MNSLFAYIGDKPCKEALLQGVMRCPSAPFIGLAIPTDKGLLLSKEKHSDSSPMRQALATDEDGTVGIAALTQPLASGATEDKAMPYERNGNLFALNGNCSAEEAEALAQAIIVKADSDRLAMMKKHLAEQHGSVVIFSEREQCLYCRAGLSTLYIATAEHGFFIADTLAALPGEAVRFYHLKKGESAKITRERVAVYDLRLRKIKKPMLSSAGSLPTQGALFPDGTPLSFPLTAKACIRLFIQYGVLVKEAVCPLGRELQRITHVMLAGDGDALLAAKMAATRISELADLPTSVYESSDPALANALIGKGTLLIAIAPEGRDDAAAQCIERAGRLGAVTMAVTADAHSPLSLTAASHLAVPSGNTLVSTYLALSFFSLYIGNRYEVISDIYLSVTVQLATMLAGKLSTAVKAVPPLLHLSGRISHAGAVVTAGIGADVAVADAAAAVLRRALKIPAYSQSLTSLAAEAGATTRNALVLAFLTDAETSRAALLPVYRLQQAGTQVVIITTEGIAADLPETVPTVAYPDSIPLFNPLICLAGFSKICASANTLPQAEII